MAICYDELVVHTDVEGLDVLPGVGGPVGPWTWEAAGRARVAGATGPCGHGEAVDEDGAYDVMVIDCPPNLSAGLASPPSWPATPSSSPYCPTPALPPAWPT